MFCNQCGKENPDNVLSCVHCGGPLATAQPMYAGQQPPPYGAPQYGVPTPPAAPETSGKATASMVCGILSLVCFGCLTGIPAIILGHISKSEIKKSGGRLKGDGMATAGLILGYISIAIGLIIMPAIMIPNILKARMSANEASAIGSVRTIATASKSYQTTHNRYPISLGELEDDRLIDKLLANGTKSGYRFTYNTENDRFFVVAVPVKQGNTGSRSFCAGEDEVIHETHGGAECTINSPTLYSGVTD